MERPGLAASNQAMDSKDRVIAMALASIAAVLAVVVLWTRSLSNQGLEALAHASLPLDEALSNGKPTLVEFYADWCQVCHQMEPTMAQLEQTHRGALDLVLLNVENPLWEQELDQFQVRGIPTFLFYNADGIVQGRAIGLLPPEQLEALVAALLRDAPLPSLNNQGATSAIGNANPGQGSAVGPRSHGEGGG
ncbi:MAG: thioredoxin fold domain-containing protein [Synechococcus sp. SB0662_bin_45]|nr:thioredoxin domain-containing protein [Cyanobacteria bacterium MAG IRC4_bin_6]MXW12921.1 thioredoxin fold domain-containing protein [Synechococcus sp. SB0668_bin_13]MYE21353.1 thioredoxin fold domain-containing protein [Synechococcus sp. SB0662_bin_45]MYG64476.1 thioredoxin fold domain-containing protein [Synechococcus sp. SB0675_bin_7]MYI71509.1 thioredoxin fold domain-containing protein [Synechococcus sp. SB0673_bin_10]MYK86274.1 thioredoxin fold domain-containing protein [Synechococcus s